MSAVMRKPIIGSATIAGISRSTIRPGRHWRIASYSSTSGVRLLRKIAMMIASPTVASAAATAMTMSAITEPDAASFS